MTQHHIRLFEFEEVKEKACKMIRATWPGWLSVSDEEIAKELSLDRYKGRFLLFTKSGYPITKSELDVHVFGEYMPKRVFEVDGKVNVYATHCKKTEDKYEFSDGVFSVASTKLSSKVSVVI